MKYPERPGTHILEKRSVQLLSQSLPDEWVIREVSERDYGIDLYVEIVTQGKLVGELCSLQLKSTESIPWNAGSATLSNIKVSTVNYWNGLPLPVFLIWADMQQGRIHWVGVKEQQRLRADNFSNMQQQQSCSFYFADSSGIAPGSPVDGLLDAYYSEKLYREFEYRQMVLLDHWPEYDNFLAYTGRDSWAPVDPDELARLVSLYELLEFLARYCKMDWPVPTLEQLYSQDFERYKDRYYILHWENFDLAVIQMRPIFYRLTTVVLQKMYGPYRAYWLSKNSALYEYYASHDFLRPLNARLAEAEFPPLDPYAC